MSFTVGEVANLAGVSVRTLHHYDELGLVVPSERSEAGYRLYTHTDLEVLQQVLVYRELEFGLDQIHKIVSDPSFDRARALFEQRDLIEAKVERDKALLDLIEMTILSMEGGMNMSKEDMFEVFGDFDPDEYQEEVQQRWGETDAYQESNRRTKSYTKSDWARYKAESDANAAAMVAVFDTGAAPDSPEAMDIAEEARLLIDRWFYPLSREMHLGLGEMYIADPRFKANYEKHREGLAQWFRDAIAANAARA
jgi:MerR family transcriptional regulator, thiopeptide resistance regulator